MNVNSSCTKRKWNRNFEQFFFSRKKSNIDPRQEMDKYMLDNKLIEFLLTMLVLMLWLCHQKLNILPGCPFTSATMIVVYSKMLYISLAIGLLHAYIILWLTEWERKNMCVPQLVAAGKLFRNSTWVIKWNIPECLS